MTPTAARTYTEESAHFYTADDGKPLYQVAKKDGTGMRGFTLADARKMDPLPLPSVSTILRVLARPQLEAWKTEMACLAVLTTPRPAEEPLDAFVERVLHTEKIQDEEAQKARDLGTDMHAALEAYFNGRAFPTELDGWILPAGEHVLKVCPEVLYTERILIGDGYAGKCDFIGQGLAISPGVELLLDFKSSSKLPEKCSYLENRLQLSGYAYARSRETASAIVTGNLYISTKEKGAYVLHLNPDWKLDYSMGFRPLVEYWRWANNYL